ncbi:unnamed protein product [Rhizoctonia solani]|uniref:Uncharacterized protein n=1 Tax=Rhizoctonia solani TaxID=456999 RepID=A0A8H3E0H6_9AGAM|nr:unnamed protein product [Rhizoctonia solani]
MVSSPRSLLALQLRPSHSRTNSFKHTYPSHVSHTDQIWGVEWTNSNKVISVSADGTAACWDVESGKKLHATSAHPLGLISASASSSPNSSEKVVLNSVEGTVFLWDLESQGITAKRETFNREKSEESGGLFGLRASFRGFVCLNREWRDSVYMFNRQVT